MTDKLKIIQMSTASSTNLSVRRRIVLLIKPFVPTAARKFIRRIQKQYKWIISEILFFLFKELVLVNKEDYIDKKAIIIGPAITVNDELKGVKLAEFDLIVRMNKAIDTPLIQEEEEIWRQDILFHNSLKL